LEPKYSSINKKGELIVNNDRYKRQIKGLLKDYWALVFKMQSEEEVAKWDLDHFLEARAALEVFNEEIKNSSEGGR